MLHWRSSKQLVKRHTSKELRKLGRVYRNPYYVHLEGKFKVEQKLFLIGLGVGGASVFLT